jgi:hypothetical protein
MKKKFLIGVLLFVFLIPMQAWSSVMFTLNDVSDTWNDDPDFTLTDFTFTKLYTTPQDFTLDEVGDTTASQNLYSVWARDNDINEDKKYKLTLKFDFTSPLGISGAIDVAAVAQVNNINNGNGNGNGNPRDNIQFIFEDPVYATWSSGGKLKVDVQDLVMDKISDEGQIGYITFKLTYDTAPTLLPGVSPAPEPATLLLLGFGLLGMAGVSRKKN